MSGFTSPAAWFKNWVLGDGYGFGWGDDGRTRNVSSSAALSYAPIWYGVNKISGHIAQLPVSVYRRVNGGGEKLRTHPVSKLLRKPNNYQTGTVFREQISVHSILEGNGRAAIVRAGGRIVEMIPLNPECTATAMMSGEKLHATKPHKDDRLRLFFADVNDETETDALIVLKDSDVVHIPGLSLDGICGLPLRKIAQRNLNTAINTEKRLNKQVEQGFSGSLLLEAPPGMFRNQADAEEFMDYFERRHNSPEKAGKTGLLREGIKAQLIQSSNRDAEMTDSRIFQRQDAALWLGLEQILGDDASVSYNSLAEKNLAYLMNTLNRWLKRWEEELEFKLLPGRQFDADTHYIRFSTAALLKSDYKTSVESLAAAITATIINPNEARQVLDMLPYDGGDTYANPAITPGETDDPAESESADDSTDSALAPATAARLEHLFGIEAKRVSQAAERAAVDGRNFIEWMDDFYSKWENKLADWMEEMELDRQLASDHCEQSKARLLDVLDYSSNETLPANIAKCVSSWHNRITTLGACDHV